MFGGKQRVKREQGDGERASDYHDDNRRRPPRYDVAERDHCRSITWLLDWSAAEALVTGGDVAAATGLESDMICKKCGTEIADKALICYRCGEATEAPTRPLPVTRQKRRSNGLVVILGFVVLMLAALFLGQAGQLSVPPVLSYTVAVLAAIVLAWRIWQRRRR